MFSAEWLRASRTRSRSCAALAGATLPLRQATRPPNACASTLILALFVNALVVCGTLADSVITTALETEGEPAALGTDTPGRQPALDARAQAMRSSYFERGMAAFAKGDDAAARGYLHVFQAYCEEEAGLFVQRSDGYWVYRVDELSKLYALASFYNAVSYAREPVSTDQPYMHKAAERNFCRALEARPDVIMPLVRKERLGARARRMLQRALAPHRQSPAPGLSCYVKGGWKAKEKPGVVNPEEYY